ncbi:MAG: acyl-CoA dehydrogenase family protein, partial [bacterium]|nr:acyl-CoA dehydrogenase family protein [bacterium]
MDFSFPEEQQQFQSSVRQFVDKEVIPVARELDEQAEFPLDLFNDYFSPGKNINLLIPAGIKTTIKVFVDHKLVKTRIIDPWKK